MAEKKPPALGLLISGPPSSSSSDADEEEFPKDSGGESGVAAARSILRAVRKQDARALASALRHFLSLQETEEEDMEEEA